MNQKLCNFLKKGLLTFLVTVQTGLLMILVGACTEDPAPALVIPPAKTGYEYLTFNQASATHLSITKTGDYSYRIVTTADDPYIQTDPLRTAVGKDSVILAFEYKSTEGVRNVQIFFTPVSEARSVNNLNIAPSTAWTNGSFNLRKQLADFGWGKTGDYLRVDFGPIAGAEIEIRNIHFRGINSEELQEENVEQEALKREQQAAEDIKNYLSADYPAQVSEVTAGANKITVNGVYSGEGSYSLCEIAPWQDVTQTTLFAYKTPLTGSPFHLDFDRFVVREGITCDRTLSRWILVKNENNKDVIVSHARYADFINASQDLQPGVLTGKKGLGGFFNHNLQRQDLNDLNIKSVTVNVPITNFICASPDANRIEHTYGGKTWYFDREQVTAMDNTLKVCAQRNIVTAAIILVQKASECRDPAIGAALQHPDFTSSGIYTMPNMTTPESVNTYAAALDFFAQRYCRSDNQYGRIHHWIMHNEVDCGISWTNMGTNRAMMVYMDAYVKSMRICYNIARQYDANTEVFGSFTHSWTKAIILDGYATRDMLDALNAYSKVEGDFQWGLAYHPYPQNLLEPKTWLDTEATFSMNSRMVTFKNPEVLDKWAKQPENQYKGTTKRSVWFSENGTSSKSYSEADLREQAAGFAYAWKKIKALDGIDGIQWHNWFDHPVEAADGLRIGLRTDQLVAKPVWFLYQVAETSGEDAAFEPYKAIIGISDWNIIQAIY
ncbi:hypothetical protein EZS27_004532 [termite gut metagenome]|uniref:DUF5722 domain-containing protein n=1 Tax=termite gut metagenome TaxID=433724 RepID=A0A5J4SS88_9ZZZZ